MQPNHQHSRSQPSQITNNQTERGNFAGVHGWKQTGESGHSESQMSNYTKPDNLETQKRREALFQGGAGQVKPQSFVFLNRKMIELQNGTDASTLLNMGVNHSNMTSLNHDYGKFQQGN